MRPKRRQSGAARGVAHARRLAYPRPMSVEMLQRLQPLRSLPLLVQYLATALIALAFFGLRYLLGGAGEQLPLFILFMPAVLLAAFLFDRGSGYFAVLVSTALGLYFLVDPQAPRAGLGTGDLLRLGAFFVAGLAAAAIVQMLRRHFGALADRSETLARAVEELEAKVAALEASDAQKELLLHDINHRIKNQLQVVAG